MGRNMGEGMGGKEGRRLIFVVFTFDRERTVETVNKEVGTRK